MDKFLTPIARLFIGHIFLLAGFSKIGQYAGTQGYMEAMGVPSASRSTRSGSRYPW